MLKEKRVNHIIAQQIEWRYHLLHWVHHQERSMRNKEIYDSYFPGLIYESILNDSDILSTVGFENKNYVLSERIAKATNSPLLHISDITTMLGYTKTEISKILAKVKKNKPKILLLGMGGSGSNFLHWAYQMAEWTNKLEIFEKLTLIDFDNFDTSNLLRIPFMLEDTARTTRKTNMVPKRYGNISKVNRKYAVKITEKSKNYFDFMKDAYVYGAPDLTTRKLLNEKNIPYFAATHKDNRCGIKFMPNVDDELGIENYGKINLTIFFLNHIQMTIEFLKFLGEPRELERDEQLFYHDYDTNRLYLAGKSLKAGTKKLYIPKINVNNRYTQRIEEE